VRKSVKGKDLSKAASDEWPVPEWELLVYTRQFS